MNGKLEEEYLEYQNKLNLSEIYTNEEIKLLKNSIPDISKILYLVTSENQNYINNINNKKNVRQLQSRYISPLKKIKNNSNYAFYTDKENFLIYVLGSIKQIFNKEKNFLLTKCLTLIMNEIINMLKIIKQNFMFNKYFKSIKKAQLNEINKSKQSYSQNNNNNNKKIKIKFNLQTKNDFKTGQITRANLSDRNESNIKEMEMNINLNVKKQFSFKIENNINNKRKKISKSLVEFKEKEKNNKGNSLIKDEINSLSKINPTLNNTKKNITTNLNPIKINKNINHRNIITVNNLANPTKNERKLNKNFFLGPSKISLKKVQFDKKYGLYDLIYNKYDYEYNLTNINQNYKKNFREREKENLIKKKLEKIENNNLKKIILPSSIDSKIYQNIDTQEFNIFKLEKEIGRENVLSLIGYYIYKYFKFDEIIKYNRYEKWCQKITEGYIRNNFYHNDLHAADITHTCFLYFKLGEIENIHKFSKSNICSLFLSCICHDYQHPGVNNNFLKETNNKIAIRYNDSSILENMHISKTFKLILNNREYNIFDGIEKTLYKEMRKEMISCVLSTDMSFHNIYIDFLKKCLDDIKEEKKGNENNDNKDKEDTNQKYMNLLIHSADISNPTKIFDIYFEWAKLVVEEFWAQGDKEKNLNLVCSCDREKVTIYQSQLGFINFIEIPYFSLFAELNTKMKFFYDNLLNNKNILLSMQEKEKEKKEKEKDKHN